MLKGNAFQMQTISVRCTVSGQLQKALVAKVIKANANAEARVKAKSNANTKPNSTFGADMITWHHWHVGGASRNGQSKVVHIFWSAAVGRIRGNFNEWFLLMTVLLPLNVCGAEILSTQSISAFSDFIAFCQVFCGQYLKWQPFTRTANIFSPPFLRGIFRFYSFNHTACRCFLPKFNHKHMH